MAETRTVTINADGIQEREVAYVRYELNQQTDVEGQPTGRTRGGKITVKVKSKMFEYNSTHDQPLQEADGTLVEFENPYVWE